MGRNRKSQSAELRFGPALKALLICFFIGGAGIGYVYQKNILNKLGQEIKNRERDLKLLESNNEAQETRLQRLNSARLLEERVREMQLDLIPASPTQIVVIVDGEPQAVAPARPARRPASGSPLARGAETERHRP
jgi:hypothetical protein